MAGYSSHQGGGGGYGGGYDGQPGAYDGQSGSYSQSSPFPPNDASAPSAPGLPPPPPPPPGSGDMPQGAYPPPSAPGGYPSAPMSTYNGYNGYSQPPPSPYAPPPQGQPQHYGNPNVYAQPQPNGYGYGAPLTGFPPTPSHQAYPPPPPYAPQYVPQGMPYDPYQRHLQSIQERARNAFMAADTDNNRYLDLAEFSTVLKNLGFNCDYAKSLQLFAMADKDQSGRIQMHEFIQLYCEHIAPAQAQRY